MDERPNRTTSITWMIGAAAAIAGVGALWFLTGPPALGGDEGRPSGKEVASSDGVPPFVPPPETGPERWNMPGLWQRDPPFPYLPGENRSRSRSIGGVVHGYLVNSVPIPQPHPGLAFLDVQHDRKLYFTTDRMREIVEGAAAHVREFHPEAVVRLGNFGNPGGGDIPWSFSHNSGRDADLAFFVRGPDGEPVTPPDLVSLDSNGHYDGEHGEFQFDVARNWRLVEGLIQAGGDQLQYLFVSNPLRRDLLDRAEEVGADAKTRRRARQILHQPSGSLPHDDHFHVRIYCSKIDVESGCWDRGRKHPWYDDHSEAKAAKIREAREKLTHETALVRAKAARRLALLEDVAGREYLVRRLEDDAPLVRAAAARALARLDTSTNAVVRRIEREEHPQVYLEMVDALGRLGDGTATRALISELGNARRLDLPGEFGADSRTFVADALIRTERGAPVEELIEFLDADNPRVRTAAAHALRYLTNHQFGSNWADADASRRDRDTAKWREWFANHRDERRDTWLIDGFRAAGYDVDRLDANHVWGLCRAITDADYLSYNAQRSLMRIADRHPESLSWSKEDASVFWRLWFERRRGRYGVPPIPAELSVVH